MDTGATLTALTLVERLLMEDGEAVAHLRDSLTTAENVELVGCLARILAMHMYATHGELGALEALAHLRMTTLAAQAGEVT